jgi:hypothetical protein
LAVVSLADLMFAKVSAFSSRGIGRDLIDLFAVDQQRDIDWAELLARAAQAPDNDYNPLEFLRKLQTHSRDCARSAYLAELPVSRPPAPARLREFIGRLTAANQKIARAALVKGGRGIDRF